MVEPHRTSDIVVIGGGIVGQATARALLGARFGVTILDRGPFGKEASWAGAGILAPTADHPVDDPFVRLRYRSAEVYPVWTDQLRDETGIDCGYRRSGGADVALTEQEEEHLRISAGLWRRDGVVFERLPPGDFGRVEPSLTPEARAVYFLPDRAQVRNPWLLKALSEANTRRGVVARPKTTVLNWVRAGPRIESVETTSGRISAGTFVIAAGAWTGPLLGALGLTIETPPIKGQIVLLRQHEREGSPLRRIVENGPRYLVPRGDGLVLVGATEEHSGYDVLPTEQALSDLVRHAARLCPTLARAEVQAIWSGLRPGSRDSRPYIGRVPGLDNVIVASGHRRSGLQMAPATAEAVADLLSDRPTRFSLEPFRLDRPSHPDEVEVFRS